MSAEYERPKRWRRYLLPTIVVAGLVVIFCIPLLVDAVTTYWPVVAAVIEVLLRRLGMLQ